MSDFTDFLQKRRSTIISKMKNDPLPASDIDTILSCGVRVPDHGVLGPWKIITIKDEARSYLGKQILRPEFAKQFPETNEESLLFEEKRLERASIVLAVLSTPKEHPKIPVWEMELSAGAVCMNLVTAAQSLGYAAQWVTEWYAYNPAMLHALGGRPDIDKVAGYIYVGYNTEPLNERRRPEFGDVIENYQIPSEHASS